MGEMDMARELRIRAEGGHEGRGELEIMCGKGADEIDHLRARIAALEAREKRLVAVLEDAKGTLGFLRSVIESGERWTMTAEDRYRETRTKIRAELDAIKGGGDDG